MDIFFVADEDHATNAATILYRLSRGGEHICKRLVKFENLMNKAWEYSMRPQYFRQITAVCCKLLVVLSSQAGVMDSLGMRLAQEPGGVTEGAKQ